MELFAQGKYSEALRAFEESDRPLLYNVACCQYRLEMNRSCIKTCTQSLEIDQSNLGFHVLRGDSYQRMGKPKKAAAAWKQGQEAANARSDTLLFLELHKRMFQTLSPTAGKEHVVQQITPVLSFAVVDDLMQEAHIFRHKKPVNQLRRARLTWQQILEIKEVQGHDDILCTCLTNMGEVALKNQQWGIAVGHLGKAVQLMPAAPRRVHALVCHAKALVGSASSGDGSASRESLFLATRSLQKAKTELAVAKGGQETGGGQRMKLVGEWWDMEDNESDDDITAMQVRVLARSGEEDLAIELCQQVRM
jgi:tetratricopeptide (TPR) repeat protein